MPLWLTFIDHRGKPCLRGPYHSDMQAQEKADRLEFDVEIVTLPTSDPDRATRILKERRIEGEGYVEGIRNFRHKGLEAHEIY